MKYWYSRGQKIAIYISNNILFSDNNKLHDAYHFMGETKCVTLMVTSSELMVKCNDTVLGVSSLLICKASVMLKHLITSK